MRKEKPKARRRILSGWFAIVNGKILSEMQATLFLFHLPGAVCVTLHRRLLFLSARRYI